MTSTAAHPAPAPGRAFALPEHAALVAVLLCALAGWLLLALARWGWFGWWWVALGPLAAALGLGALAWWRAAIFDKVAVVALIAVGIVLYTPPAQQIALAGDAAIYPNEAAYIARGATDAHASRPGCPAGEALCTYYEPFAALSPATEDLFYIDSDEQFPWAYAVRAYDGLIYGGYYVTDAASGIIHPSRMLLTEALAAGVIKAAGLPASFYLNSALSIVAILSLYAIARLFFRAPLALFPALLLAVSYPQIHFARAPFAEITGQVLTLWGLLLALLWLRAWRAVYLAAALLLWATAWAARVDALLLLGPAGLLLLIAAWRRDGGALRAALAVSPLVALIVYLGFNRPYVGSTFEQFSILAPVFLPGLVAGAIALPGGMALAWRLGPRLEARAGRWAAWLGAAAFAATALMMAWALLPHPWRTPDVTRPFQEIIWFSSAYVTPLFYWLTLAGLGAVLWLRRERSALYVAVLFLGLGLLYFYDYSSAPVYPVSLRRLTPDVFPLMALLCGFALDGAGRLLPGRGDQAVQALLALAALAWMGSRAAPLLAQHETPDDAAFVAALHAALPGDAAVLFEPQDGDSWIGWLAAPLYSLYGDWALLLESDAPDPALLAQAAGELEAAGRAVYIASQQEPLPPALTPPGYAAGEPLRLVWQSAIIGQTRTPPYPPPFWEFALPVNLYPLTAE